MVGDGRLPGVVPQVVRLLADLVDAREAAAAMRLPPEPTAISRSVRVRGGRHFLDGPVGYPCDTCLP